MAFEYVKAALASVLLAGLASAHAATVEPPPGTVSLWDSNFSNRVSLRFNNAWGWSEHYNFKVTDAVIGAGAARYVAFNNIPSASTVVLSSGEFCEQNEAQDFWIELTAVQEHASYPAQGETQNLSMAALMALQPNQIYGGLRVKAKYQKPGGSLNSLSCARMTTSRSPGQVVPATPVELRTEAWREAGFSAEAGTCPDSPLMVGRQVYIDGGRGHTLHRCASPLITTHGETLVRKQVSYNNGYDLCPANTALRGFNNSFPGDTTRSTFFLTCQTLRDTQDRPLAVKLMPGWHGPYTEEDHQFSCPNNTVLVGRKTEKGERQSRLRTENWYACGSILGYSDSTVASPAPIQADNGTVTFYSAQDPSTGLRQEYPQTLDTPGTSRHYEFRNWDSKVPNNKAELLVLNNIPSATTITLTDDDLCDPQKGDFSVALNAWKDGATLTARHISDLGGNDIGYPVGDGLRLKAIRGQPAREKLSCMIVELSRLPGQPMPNDPVPAGAGQWYTEQESDHDFTCPTGVLVGATRKGDENGDAGYRCSTLPQLTPAHRATLEGISESGGHWVMCPFDTVLTGRGHKGDENKDSTYRCASVTLGDKPLAVRPDPDWNETQGNDHVFTCPDNKVLVGRQHQGDENKPTRYRCAALLR